MYDGVRPSYLYWVKEFVYLYIGIQVLWYQILSKSGIKIFSEFFFV